MMPLVPSPFGTLPQQTIERNAAVLLVGQPGAGKRTLGNMLLQAAANTGGNEGKLAINVRTTSKMPLQTDPSRPRVDFVVFVVNLTSQLSWEVVKEAVRKTDPFYFLGRSCIVATHQDKAQQHCVDQFALESLAYECHTPLYFANLLELDSAMAASEHAVRLVQVVAGYVPNVTSLLLAVTPMDEVVSTQLSGLRTGEDESDSDGYTTPREDIVEG